MVALIIIGIIISLYIVISFIVQLSQKDINLNKPDWKKYRVKKGKSNFWPLEPWWLIFNPKGFDFAVFFNEEAYQSIEEWTDEGVLDKDREDWNKLLGLTQFYTFNNYNAAMIAFKWGNEPNTFKIAGYTNHPSSQFQWSEDLEFTGDLMAHGSCVFVGNEAHYTLQCQDKVITWNTPFKRSSRWLMRRVGTSMGGANNSPGKYGGKSLKSFYLHLVMRYF